MNKPLVDPMLSATLSTARPSASAALATPEQMLVECTAARTLTSAPLILARKVPFATTSPAATRASAPVACLEIHTEVAA